LKWQTKRFMSAIRAMQQPQTCMAVVPANFALGKMPTSKIYHLNQTHALHLHFFANWAFTGK
jgi:hypothetical protein